MYTKSKLKVNLLRTVKIKNKVNIQVNFVVDFEQSDFKYLSKKLL